MTTKKTLIAYIVVTSTCALALFASMHFTQVPKEIAPAEPEIKPLFQCGVCAPEGHDHNATLYNAHNFAPAITRISDEGKPLTLETKHLLIRPFNETDGDALYAYAKNPDVSARADWAPHRSRLQTNTLLKKWLSQPMYPMTPMVVEEKSSKTFVGTATIVGIYMLNPAPPRATVATCLTNYGHVQEYEVEVLQALCEWCMIYYGCTRVDTFVRKGVPKLNEACKKAGMECEGRELDLKKIAGQYTSYNLYALIRHDVAPALTKTIIPRSRRFNY